MNLNTTDFINLMMTQLENQDPLNRTSSDELMSQMSQIGQLQSTSQLQTTMQQLTAQSQIGSASSLIGKQVSGLDVNSNQVSGIVVDGAGEQHGRHAFAGGRRFACAEQRDGHRLSHGRGRVVIDPVTGSPAFVVH